MERRRSRRPSRRRLSYPPSPPTRGQASSFPHPPPKALLSPLPPSFSPLPFWPFASSPPSKIRADTPPRRTLPPSPRARSGPIERPPAPHFHFPGSGAPPPSGSRSSPRSSRRPGSRSRRKGGPTISCELRPEMTPRRPDPPVRLPLPLGAHLRARDAVSADVPRDVRVGVRPLGEAARLQGEHRRRRVVVEHLGGFYGQRAAQVHGEDDERARGASETRAVPSGEAAQPVSRPSYASRGGRATEAARSEEREESSSSGRRRLRRRSRRRRIRRVRRPG